VGAAGASGVALALGLFHLGAKSFWLDEAFSVAAAGVHRGLHQVLLADAGNFAFYYLLLHLWLQAGTGDTWVRGLSVLFAAAAPPLLFVAGRRIVGSKAALLGAFVMACNPLFVSYAQEARGYSLLLALSILSTYLLVLCLRSPEPGVRVAYVGVTTLMLYTHFFGVWVVAWHAVILALSRVDAARRRGLVGALGAVAVLTLPLAYSAVRRGTSPVSWIPAPTWHSLLGFFVALAGSGLLLAAYLVVAAIGMQKSFLPRSGRGESSNERPWPFLAIWFAVPVILTLIVSVMFQPIFVPRYLIIVLPPVALAVGFGLSTLRPPALALACALLALLSAVGVHQAYAAPKDDWQAAAAAVALRQRPGDAIVFNPPWLAIPFEHAYRRLRQQPALESPPDLSPDWAPPRFNTPPGWRTRLRQPRRVWFIVGARGPDIKPAFINDERAEADIILRALAPRRRVRSVSFAGITVYLYATKRATQPVRGEPIAPGQRRDVR
jgi:mannosyltransferase